MAFLVLQIRKVVRLYSPLWSALRHIKMRYTYHIGFAIGCDSFHYNRASNGVFALDNSEDASRSGDSVGIHRLLSHPCIHAQLVNSGQG